MYLIHAHRRHVVRSHPGPLNGLQLDVVDMSPCLRGDVHEDKEPIALRTILPLLHHLVSAHITSR